MRFFIPFIFSFSFLFSQNNEITRESFLDKIQNYSSEDELNSLFEISKKKEIISQFNQGELFGYRMIILMDLVRLRNENQEKYLESAINFFC